MRTDASVEKGFTLLEIVIALSIMAIIGMALMSLTTLMNSAQQDAASQMGRDSFRSTLLQVFGHPNSCEAALNSQIFPNGMNPTIFDSTEAQAAAPAGLGLPLNITLNSMGPGALGAIKIRSWDPANYIGKVPPPKPLPQYNIAYQYILFQNAVPLGPDTDFFPKNTLWQGVVTMTVVKMGGVSDLTHAIAGGNSLPQQTVGSLIISVNTGNGIDRCESVAVVNNDCTNYGGIPNPAYNPLVPTSGPPCLVNTGSCPVGSVFGGTNPVTGGNICNPVPLTCPPGQGLVPGPLGFVCQTP